MPRLPPLSPLRPFLHRLCTALVVSPPEPKIRTGTSVSPASSSSASSWWMLCSVLGAFVLIDVSTIISLLHGLPSDKYIHALKKVLQFFNRRNR
ncbi:hypothetical protein VPH35_090838 [Triticum aestivum]